MFWFNTDTSGIFAHIPLGMKGKLYASPMPYGPYDRFNRLMRIYKRHEIRWAIVLVTEDEIKRKAKRDLFKAYWKARITPVHHPITDMTSPDFADLAVLVEKIVSGLREGNVAVHCNAGVGRTGLVIGCVIKRIRKCSTDEAIALLKDCIKVNFTTDQRRCVEGYDPGAHNPTPASPIRV